jgi:hypothetical protein
MAEPIPRSERNISASVGRLATNKSDDVFTIQELLNAVPAAEGGPTPPLELDGLSGPKTISAIQHFQLKHFGFKGADGKVEPGKQTLAKLNEIYDRLHPAPPPPPPPAPPRKVLFTKFVFHQPGKANTDIPTDSARDLNFFFKVTGVTETGESDKRLYWFGPLSGYERVTGKPGFLEGGGVALSIFTIEPPGRAITELATASGMYITRSFFKQNRKESTLVLLFPSPDQRATALRIPVRRHLGITISSSSGTAQDIDPGQFQLVERPERWVQF